MGIILSKDFDLNFNGHSSDGINFNCGLKLSGDPKTIGRMLAEFALAEIKNKHLQPLEILLSALETLQSKMPGIEMNPKIITPSS